MAPLGVTLVASLTVALTHAAAPTRDYTLFKLEVGNPFNAVCLDGTPGSFYFSEGTTDDWVFYFQGGGWCYDVGDCYGRSLGNLGSSAKLAPKAGGMGGLMSFDPAISPLANYNSVWLNYCDGNSFSGLRDEPVVWNNGTANVSLHFRGRAIIDGVIDALKRNVMGASHLFADARNVVETGCSAGGLATYLHADYVAEQFPHSGSYSSIPISGYFLDHASVTGEKVYSEQIKVIHALSNASTNAACEAAHAASGDLELCNMAEHVYPFIKANLFILNSAYDSWQTGCIMTAEPVALPNNTRANGNCSAAPGWNACARNPASCTADQITGAYLPFGAYLDTTIASTPKSSTPGNGGFLTSCHTHCEGQGSAFTTFSIGGVKMGDAVRAWLASNAAAPGGAAPSADNWHVDCAYLPGTATHQCNPSCGAGSGPDLW